MRKGLNNMKPINEQLEIIKRGTVEIIQLAELKAKLEHSRKSGKPLVVKAGFDPTAPDIHLGHTVLLRKLRHFQELGHKVIFLIGDATATIGDPSGVSKTRPQLTIKEIEKNAKTYKKQISKVLDVKKLKIRFNSEWLDKMNRAMLAELMSKFTVNQILERDDFANRYKQHKPVGALELLYPLLQGYDSVALRADIELGGTDQKFNLLMARDIQIAYGQKAQVVITMPLLEGTDGVDKMSKSLGNYIGIEEPPKEMFGKIMSVSDELMLKYYELLTDEPIEKLKEGLKLGSLHPKNAKKNLAKIIITQYYDKKKAFDADANFEKAFKHGEFPGNVKLNCLKAGEISGYVGAVLSRIAGVSKTEVRRKLNEGAVEINGQKVIDPYKILIPGCEYKIRLGKRFFRVKIC